MSWANTRVTVILREGEAHSFTALPEREHSMLGLGWQELIIVVLAIVFIAGFLGIGKLGGSGKSPFAELVERYRGRTDAEERGSTL